MSLTCLSAWLVLAFNKCWNTLTRLAKIRMPDTTRCWGGRGTVSTLSTAGKHALWSNSSGKQFCSFYKVTDTYCMTQPFHSQVSAQGTEDVCPHKDLYTHIADLFTIAEDWKQTI